MINFSMWMVVLINILLFCFSWSFVGIKVLSVSSLSPLSRFCRLISLLCQACPLSQELPLFCLALV